MMGVWSAVLLFMCDTIAFAVMRAAPLLVRRVNRAGKSGSQCGPQPCQQLSLIPTVAGRDKYCVIAGNGTDNFGPVTAIQKQCNPCCGTRCCVYDCQASAGRAYLADERNRCVSSGVCRRSDARVAVIQLADTQFPQIPADAGLRGVDPLRLQQSHQFRLPRNRALANDVQNGSTAAGASVGSGRHSKSDVDNMHIQ